MEFQHELIIPNKGMPFKLFLFEGDEGNYVREKHWHTSVEIFAVMEGSLSFFLNEKEYLMQAGDLIIVNSNEIHSILAPEKNLTVVMQIPLKEFTDYFTADHFIRFSRKGNARNPELAQMIQHLYSFYLKKETGYEFKMLSIYNEIRYLLVCDYRVSEVHESEIQSSRRLETLSKITTYMREHYREDLKLSGVAEAFGYSDAYLSRMFRKYAKVNFKSYLQDIRVAYAYQDLMNTDHTISQIALDNGFCSSRGFAKDFKKRYGVLPNEVQKQKKVKKVL